MQDAAATTTVTLQRGGTVLIVKEVPADACRDCGEYYLDSLVAIRVEKQVEEAVERNTEIEILCGRAILRTFPEGF